MTDTDDKRESLQQRFPHRATRWQLRTRAITFDNCPAVMGIVNVTPDSFSDGGAFFDSRRAIEHGLRLAEEGADILDVGGESTRPYSTPVEVKEELQRVVAVVQGLAERCDLPISIDTSKAAVAAEAIHAGAEIINDVTGLEDPHMVKVAQTTRAGVCAMHMQGTPLTMQDAPTYDDVVANIKRYLQDRYSLLQQAGIRPESICLDPGIGFGKTHQHNLTLLSEMGRYHELGAPLLVGHSRKGFLAKILGDRDMDRTFATVGVSLALAMEGVQVIRVHDVLPVRQALVSFAAVGAIDGKTLDLENK